MDGERLKNKTVTESIYVLKCIPIDFAFTLSSQSEEDLRLLKGDCNMLLNSNLLSISTFSKLISNK